jgi:hypothetical protein
MMKVREVLVAGFGAWAVVGGYLNDMAVVTVGLVGMLWGIYWEVREQGASS